MHIHLLDSIWTVEVPAAVELLARTAEDANATRAIDKSNLDIVLGLDDIDWFESMMKTGNKMIEN